MLRSLLLLVFLMLSTSYQALAQASSYEEEIVAYRKAQNEEFLNPEKSPLTSAERKDFKGHDFFPIDESYKVVARFEPTPDAKPFALKTSRGTSQLFRRLGVLHFELNGEAQILEAYMRVQRFSLPGQAYVFLPLIDVTTGGSTYGAGRYLHYEGIPEGDQWVIDFNKLYNPSCAYNDKYECPMVPEPNHLAIAVEAGVKGY